MYTRIAIATILLAYLVLASTYSLLTPLGEGPDEPGHAKYVFFLAREWRLPVQCAAPCQSEVPGEGHQPPLAYLLATPALLWVARDQRSFDLPGNRSFVWAAGTQVNAVGHGSREYWPWQGEVLAWHLVRFINVVLGAGVVFCTYRIAQSILSKQVGLISAALMAFNPQFLFSSGLITNDVLLTLLCAILTLLLVAPIRSDTPPGRLGLARLLAIGATLGLALLTKQSALLLVPIVGLWCVIWQRVRQHNKVAHGWQLAFGSWFLVFGIALILSGWWYLRNAQVYGDLFGLAAFQAEFITQAFEAGKPDAWWSALTTLHESFWARFGWMNVRPPNWVIWLYSMLELLALAGIVRQLGRWRVRHRSTVTMGDQLSSAIQYQYWPIIALPLLTFAWLVSFAFTAGLVAWQGRLLFPTLPAIAIGLAYGLVGLVSQGTKNQEPRTKEQIHHPVRLHLAQTSALPYVLCIAWFALMVGVAAWLPFGVIRPSYPFYALPAAAADAHIANPIYARFATRADERGAALRNITIEGTKAAGETLQIKLLWNALGRQNRDWWVFIHLVDAQGNILSEDNRQPTDGGFPMSQWVAGDWVESMHPLVLPATLPPGTYQLRIGLWYPKTERRAGYFDQGTKLLGDFYGMLIQVER